ncbi:MAG: response regulator [Cyanobacteria bacterium CRU_2_1]|nr:response regulator [Cyanobacteria bacterium CRU_2_1]
MMLRILLIDDNPHDRRLVIHALEQAFPGLEFQEIIQATDFEQALEAGQFDLVVTDSQLRWTDGLSILRTIRTQYPDHPIIMFTNSGSQEIAVEAMKLGLDDYVIKSASQCLRLPSAIRLALERVETRRKAAGLETRLHTLLNQLNVGIYRMSLDGALLEGNRAFLRLLGLEFLTEIQANDTLEPYFQPEDYAQLLSQLKQADEVPTYEAFPTETQQVQLCRADRQKIWVRISKTFITINGFTIIDGLIEDISEAMQQREEGERLLQLEQAARIQAESANRIKDEFLAILSHELRSPLNSILGWAKLLQSQMNDPVIVQRAIQTIERNAVLQTQLIEDLLDVSRILQGKLSLKVTTVNLISVIEAAIETMRLAANAKSIQIETRLDATVGLVTGDATRLQQVVWNLLSNAIKFTSASGQVDVSLERAGSSAQIQVTDTGKGIRADFLPYVFDYFRQSDSSTTRSYGGLGLGLAISRHLVELHGGTIEAVSLGEGQGATFIITLPILLTESESATDAHPFSLNPDASPFQGLHILVVDDETDTRELLTFVLEQHGATVTAVSSVAEALEAFQRLPLDLLVSDISMPNQDGYSLIRAIRLSASTQSQIPAIALTAHAREEDRKQAFASGFQLHVSKPVDPFELVVAIARLVECS